jgi:hypothetical protein
LIGFYFLCYFLINLFQMAPPLHHHHLAFRSHPIPMCFFFFFFFHFEPFKNCIFLLLFVLISIKKRRKKSFKAHTHTKHTYLEISSDFVVAFYHLKHNTTHTHEAASAQTASTAYRKSDLFSSSSSS